MTAITVTVNGELDDQFETEEDAIRNVAGQAGIEYIRKFSLWLFGDHSEPLDILNGDVVETWTYED